MLDEYRTVLDELSKIEDPSKVSAMQTWFVIKCIMAVVYYLVAGIVAWALGRRLIQATFAALREARRSGAGD